MIWLHPFTVTFTFPKPAEMILVGPPEIRADGSGAVTPGAEKAALAQMKGFVPRFDSEALGVA